VDFGLSSATKIDRIEVRLAERCCG